MIRDEAWTVGPVQAAILDTHIWVSLGHAQKYTFDRGPSRDGDLVANFLLVRDVQEIGLAWTAGWLI